MRRRIFFLATAAAGMLAAPGAVHAATRRRFPELSAARRLQLRHAASGAKFSGIYRTGQSVDPGAMAELSEVLADTRTGAVRPFDPEVIDILWELGQQQKFTEFAILSGYRTPATNRAVHGAGDSQHLRAAALDVEMPAAKFDAFGEAALRLARGGVGLYPQHGFIHVDSGPVRRWGGGGPAGTMAVRAPKLSPAEERLNRLAEAWAAARR
ncbi:DUF882 domain-containing protein [Roseomonas sp. E05]|uniref:YcbK family protein n=1 Tax=Roseomonas sp. E05 TaxID=3046310 RepID=UPI0032D91485